MPQEPLAANKISFLGSGRIARALIQGLLKTESVAPHEIFVTSHSGVSAKHLAEELGVTAAMSNNEAIEAASMIILCTKPAQALATITTSQKSLANKLLLSMAAGIRSEDLFQAAGGKARIMRAMPNTSVRVGKGTIVLAPHPSTTPEDLLLVKKVFSACAALEEISEEKMDAVTALSGSGPAFALLFLEGLVEAGLQTGLDPKIARSLAAHTLEGAAALILQTEQSPQELRAEITSPNGTTAAGLRVLEEAGFKKIIEQAVKAARLRAQELAVTK
ncbi:MAG: pyrroline-5-carboxylate reductase [Verrucomicrobiae bacterium]|nr:pyrroline-5-carboxylate reductase [Verrucomicrobiae bacterium]